MGKAMWSVTGGCSRQVVVPDGVWKVRCVVARIRLDCSMHWFVYELGLGPKLMH